MHATVINIKDVLPYLKDERLQAQIVQTNFEPQPHQQHQNVQQSAFNKTFMDFHNHK